MSNESKGISDDDLIKKTSDYFFMNDELAQTFENFVNSNCHVIHLEDDEYSLKYTHIFEEYQALFEKEMTEFIESLGATVNDFYKALSSKTVADNESSEALFGMILQSVTEFDIFMVMMKEAAQSQRASSSSRK
jgi:hypothetical protein